MQHPVSFLSRRHQQHGLTMSAAGLSIKLVLALVLIIAPSSGIRVNTISNTTSDNAPTKSIDQPVRTRANLKWRKRNSVRSTSEEPTTDDAITIDEPLLSLLNFESTKENLKETQTTKENSMNILTTNENLKKTRTTKENMRKTTTKENLKNTATTKENSKNTQTTKENLRKSTTTKTNLIKTNTTTENPKTSTEILSTITQEIEVKCNPVSKTQSPIKYITHVPVSGRTYPGYINPVGANNVISVQSTYSVNSNPTELRPKSVYRYEIPWQHSNLQAVQYARDDGQTSQSNPKLFIRPSIGRRSAYNFETGPIKRADNTIINYRNKEATTANQQTDTQGSESGQESSHLVETLATNSNGVVDAPPSMHTDLQPNEQIAESVNVDDPKGQATSGGKSENHEQGGGDEMNDGQDQDSEDKSNSNEESDHKYDKVSHRVHDKESHSGDYDKGDKNDKSHDSVEAYHEEYDDGEGGKKEADYEEDGEFKSGENTEGGHVVHKKDEWAKKTEFYDESFEGDDNNKYGAFFGAKGKKAGGREKGEDKKHHSSEHNEGKKGKSGKGSHDAAKKSQGNHHADSDIYEHSVKTKNSLKNRREESKSKEE